MPVYLIRAGEHGPVKIGFSEDVTLRLTKMQADNHERLSVLRLLVGAQPEEALLHDRFANHHLHGEWYSYSRLMLGDLGLLDVERPSPAEPPAPPPMEESPAFGAKIGPYIVALRKSRGMTQETVAAAIGLHRSTLAGIEIGRYEPGKRPLIALARLFELSVDQLLAPAGRPDGAA